MLPLPPRRIPPLGPGKRTARQRIVAQWRGFDLGPLEKAHSIRAQRVSAVLPKVLSELRIDHRRAEAEVVKVWNDLLDPNIVAHAQPTGLRKGTLFVTVDSNVWLSEIVRYRRKEILDRLQHSFGREFIVKISFRVG
jgi:predicted nucleic acid-binding Zn ribbon protein